MINLHLIFGVLIGGIGMHLWFLSKRVEALEKYLKKKKVSLKKK